MDGWFADNWEMMIQLVINGTANGLIIALIALGYTMVYGIVELINFAHGDLYMLGGFAALTIIGLMLPADLPPWLVITALLALVPVFTAGLNWGVDRLAYRPIRGSPKLTVLVTAIGVSFIFVNVGLFWGGIPMDLFGGGNAAAAPKNVPDLLGSDNLLGEEAVLFLTPKDVLVVAVTMPLLIVLTLLITRTSLGRAMRATAQNPVAARLMGIDVDRIIGRTFLIGGAIAGVGSVIAALYNNTISFQMGYLAGINAFTAAVLGGIGNLPGAVLGGLIIGLVRSFSDVYLSTQWSNTVVFGVLILLLIFRPSGLLGTPAREKV